MRLALLVMWMSAVASACATTQAPPIVPYTPSTSSSLGPGDTFEVSVYGEGDLSGKYRVGEDGTINFPLVGLIRVADRGPLEIALTIQKALQDRKLLVDPHVSVFLLEQTSKQISVVGAVSKPGSFALTTGMTIVQAIGAAGGLTPLASGDNTIVTRRVDGQLKRLKVPVASIAEGEFEDFAMQPGDIVFVPERIF